MIYALFALILVTAMLLGTISLGRARRAATAFRGRRDKPSRNPGAAADRIGLNTDTPTTQGSFRFDGPGLDGNPPLAALLLLRDGDAQVVLGDEPAGEGDHDDWETASNALAYLVYAISREDWCAEWAQSEHQLRWQFEEGIREVERDRLRSSFEVIDGGANSDPAEENNE